MTQFKEMINYREKKPKARFLPLGTTYQLYSRILNIQGIEFNSHIQSPSIKHIRHAHDDSTPHPFPQNMSSQEITE